MALARTTLAGGCSATDTEVLLTAITGVIVGSQFNIEGESMRAVYVGLSASNPVGVYRGIRGTNVAAHPAGASVVVGAPSEFNAFARTKPLKREVVSYSASGVVGNANPGRDMVAILNGTSTLTMTLGNPTKDNDGDLLIVISGGKAAHTLTYTTTGLGGGGAATDLMTFSTVAQMAVAFVAYNELWILLGASSGAGSVAAAVVIT